MVYNQYTYGPQIAKSVNPQMQSVRPPVASPEKRTAQLVPGLPLVSLEQKASPQRGAGKSSEAAWRKSPIR